MLADDSAWIHVNKRLLLSNRCVDRFTNLYCVGNGIFPQDIRVAPNTRLSLERARYYDRSLPGNVMNLGVVREQEFDWSTGLEVDTEQKSDYSAQTWSQEEGVSVMVRTDSRCLRRTRPCRGCEYTFRSTMAKLNKIRF